MNLLIINNSGFIRTQNNYFITKTTGQFIFELNKTSSFEISLLQHSKEGNINEGINDFLVGDNIQIDTIQYFNGIKKILTYLNTIKCVFKVIKKNQGFTYIFYPGHVSLIVAYICILLKKPYGLYVRGEYNDLLSKTIFSSAKFINTVGTIFQEKIKNINKNCYLIKPMVQYDFSTMNDDKIVEKHKEVLFVGRIEKKKGVWEIVKAAEKIINVLPEYKFRLVGAGQDSKDIEKYIKNNNITNIILNGPVFNKEDLKQFYLNSDIFLFPSYDEGFPRVLYEAMYFNLPIITSFVGNIPGIMKHEHNCLRIEVQSVKSIIENILKLLSNKTLSAQLVENGRKTLSMVFNEKILDHAKLLITQLNDYEQ